MSFNVFLVSCIDLIWFVFLLGTFCSISHNRNTCVQKRALDSGWLQLLSWVFKQCSRCFSMKQLITTMDSVFLFRQSGVPLFRTTCRFEVKNNTWCAHSVIMWCFVSACFLAQNKR